MILDEATSSIDTRTEAHCAAAAWMQLMKGRTVFVIAHRLSTVQNADVIMVLDHGRIIERGTHERADRPARARITSCIPAHSSWSKTNSYLLSAKPGLDVKPSQAFFMLQSAKFSVHSCAIRRKWQQRITL